MGKSSKRDRRDSRERVSHHPHRQRSRSPRRRRDSRERRDSRDRERDRRDKKGRKHYHHSNSSRDSHSDDDRRRRREKKSPSRELQQTEEQKRMIRLAKARILANVALAHEEQEKEKQNQQIWEAKILNAKTTPEPEPAPTPKVDKPEPAKVVKVEVFEESKPVGQFEELLEQQPVVRVSKFSDRQALATFQPQISFKPAVRPGFVFSAKPLASKAKAVAAVYQEDPLDSFMQSISAEAVEQHGVHATTADTMLITAEDLENEASQDHKSDSDDEMFHQQFVEELRRKEQQPSKGVNQDDDDFLMAQPKKVEPVERKPRAERVEEPVRKDLYIESREVTQMSEKQVKQFKKESGNITVRGLNCPRPVQSWFHCGLPTPVLNFLSLMNYQKPFPIQCQTIPAIMSGRDIIGIAETGSGKTLAYVLPLLRHIRAQRPLEDGDGPIGLIFAPTRELVLQIYKETKSVARACDLTVVPVYGGVSVQNQLSELKRGAEIVVCTPGRMRDVLAASNGRITNLRRVSYIVLDEADRMLDMGFEPQIKVMIQACRSDRQTVMFSATFPRSIEALAKAALKQPIEVVVGNRGQTCASIEQQVVVLENQSEKLWRLVEVLGEWNERGSILVFVEKQADADDLFKELLKVGYKCLVLHGGMDQTDREFTIQDFKERRLNILIATSVCARGLDIKHIVLVLNYVCPNHIEDYVHRVGRTGRAGNKGTAITFITKDECASASDLTKALEQSGQPVPESLKELEELYQKKLQDGDLERRRGNIGFVGKGFKYDKDEDLTVKKQRNELAKSFGYAVDEDSDDDQAAHLAKQEMDALHQDLFQLVVRDPAAKKLAMEAGQRASIEAIKQGLSFEESTHLAREAINLTLQAYTPGVVSQDKAVQQVMRIRDQFVKEVNERTGVHTEVVEINDLPAAVRSKLQAREFLNQIAELSGFQTLVSVRGQLCDIGQKPGVGCQKLNLTVEGSSKQEAVAAAKEVRRCVEDLMQGQQNTRGLEFSGSFGKF